MQTLRVSVALALALLLGACASSNSGGVYQRGEARQIQTVKTGVVESVRQVRLEGTKTPIGGATGAVVGGVAGSTVGGGRGQIITSVLGAVVGGIAGVLIAQAASDTQVRLTDIASWFE